MTTKHAPAHAYAQVIKMGSGWAITRNSATLAVSDYERAANEIADALNKRIAYPRLVDTLRRMVHYYTSDFGAPGIGTDARNLLHSLGEL